MEQNEVQAKVDERERKRSASFIRRRQEPERHCGWNFALSLEFSDRTYELYAPTRADRDEWVRILGAVADMNRQGVDIQGISPHDYLTEQQQKE